MNKRNILKLSTAAFLVMFLVITAITAIPDTVKASYGDDDHEYWAYHDGHDHDYEEYCPWEEEEEWYDDYKWPVVECSVSNTNPAKGSSIRYSANTYNGEGPFTYNWVGDFAGSSKAEDVIYNRNGRYSVVVEATDARGNTTFNTCPLVIVNEPEPKNDLSVVCRVSDRSIEEGDRVQFTADVSGGEGPYNYDWSGDIDGDDRIEDVKFTRKGDKDAYIKVTDKNGQTASATCPIVEVDKEEDDLDVVCRVSNTSIKKGESVTYSVDVDGGNSPFDYDWSGDISGDDRRETVRFDKTGRYEVEITVEDDDGNEDTDTCPAVRVTDDNVVAATVDTVYLNQVPYTGPGDVFKIIGYILLILSASIITMYGVQRRKLAGAQSERIEAFKLGNRESNKIS